MTMQEHNEIMAKDCLGIKDVMALLDIAYPTASEQIRKWKARLSCRQELRIDIQGKIHTFDYCDIMRIEYENRFIKGEAV